MKLSVKQLAKRVLPASPSGDLDGLIRQLRHWTLTGVLQPVGDIHTGAGKHRYYDQPEVFFAALAAELTRWRIPVGLLDVIVAAARKEFRQVDMKPTAVPLANFAKEAMEGRDNVFMFVQSTGCADELETVIRIGHHDDPSRAGAETPSCLVVNLSAVFSKVRD